MGVFFLWSLSMSSVCTVRSKRRQVVQQQDRKGLGPWATAWRQVSHSGKSPIHIRLMWETDLCCCKPKTWGCSFYWSVDETSHTDEDTLKKKKKNFYLLLLFRGWGEVGAQLWLNLHIIIMYNHLNNLANQTNDPALNLLFPFKLGTSQDNIGNTRYWSDHNFP